MAKGTIMFKNMANKFKVYLECKISDIKNIKELGIIEVLNRTKVIIISLISFMMIFGFILFNAINISEEEMLEDLKKSLITENSFKIAKIIRVRDEKISESEFKPLFNYYSGNEDKIKKLINELRKNGEYGNFEIKSKQGLFYKRYYIALDTVEVEFTTNTKDIKVEFEDKKFNLQDVAQFDVIPGIYNVKYTYETQFGDICNDINISILEDKKVELKIDGNYVTLYSNFDDAKVLINNENTGLLAKEIKNFGPIPKEKDIVIKLQREFPWGTIESDEENISNQEYIKLDISMVNDELINIVSKDINGFYESVFEGLNKRNKENIINCTDSVRDSVYNYINEKTLLFSNNYEIADMNVEIEKSDFKYEDSVYKASVVTKVNYNIYKKILPFFKTYNESSFILGLEYIDNNFRITEIQKVEIE
ncbi:MAG: TcaA 3rd/4th domain-containing protein [Clostridium saudiense]|uniref:TcaA 3rd/4th domain-containing protein n=1 Tax=Clostridium TaxID=1485 RepID=UPI0006C2230F|nr:MULTISPECIES: hypothetical protein [Clostridium]MBX9186283.1 hypothetical protein [Clostridium sp. K04]MDU3522861.1 hypothetical protein [Clostridium saudiense]CUN82896.1 membrane-associated protein [Clostridium disporicum]